MITIEQANQIWKENILKTDTLDNAMAKTMQDVYQKGLEDRLQEKREVWINKKKGTRYTLLAVAKECTNIREGNIMAVYCIEGCTTQVYVRDWEEFVAKFYPEVVA